MATITSPRTERTNARRCLTLVVGLAMLFFLFRRAVSSMNEVGIIELVGGSSVSSLHSPLKLQLPPKNRTVVLVHVGKAGGLTLKEQLKEWKHTLDNNTTVFPEPVHMGSQLRLLEEATTYLVAVRNPVDRIISSYLDSHVKTCKDWTDKMQSLDRQGNRTPFGCSIKHKSKSNQTMRLLADKVFGRCFPSGAMEDFAQSVMSPWPELPPPKKRSMELPQQRDCQLLARQMVEGSLANLLVAPHMEFNYEYYASKSIRQYPAKEVWVVRLEHMEQDFIHLQRALGANTTTETDLPSKMSHGIEGHMTSLLSPEGSIPSLLSPEAYQKLCCVLHKELQVYEEFLSNATNLHDYDRQESMQEVRTKCGLTMNHQNWEDWRDACKAQLAQEWEILQQLKPAR